MFIAKIVCIFYVLNCAESEHITIIGGGASGLAAASKLIENGQINLTILEATNRLGGRAYCVPASSITRNATGYLEMGAQFIHGQIGSPSYKIAKEHDLVDPEFSNFDGDFVIMEKEDNSENWDLWTLYEILEKEPENEDIYPGISLEQYILTYRNTSLYNSLPPERQKYVKPFLDLYNRYQLSNDVETWNNISAKAFFDYEYPGGPEGSDHTRFKAEYCYADMIKILHENIPDEQIFLESPVSVVNYTQSQIQITLVDGSVLETDKVIFTGSLGVLKANMVQFDPQLPKNKQEAIEQIGFGTLGKIYIELDQPWVAQDWITGFSFLFENNIEYTKLDAMNDWTRFVAGIWTVDHQPTIAEMWIGGEGAIYMENLSGYRLREDVEKLLDKFSPSMGNLMNTTRILSITVSQF